ncbi:uncharacterized protein LOC113227598 [Hyposmocoma kahamanoa]|uniref:uncharacterized protein LOC113227598 n=1 Tax=Hyposmocoma kahamanoa TaxID=1477025 RepID=UPI000E6D6A77|nr:uncharacterized protein LOC113227598 [Hyposmocoma kahamanoa]
MSIYTPGVTVTSTITSEVIVARSNTNEVITNTDTPEVIVLNTDAPEAIISSTDGLKADVTFTNALNNNVTSTSITTTTDNSTLTTNNFTTVGFNFRASDIIWPQASDIVFDSAFVGNGTEGKTTTKESIMESTTDVKLISAMSTNPQKQHTENFDDLRTFKSMKSADNPIPASNMSVKKNITNLVTLNSTPNAGSPVSENQSSINEDYPIFPRRLYSHALSNEVGAYPSINKKNPLWKITQDPDSIASENGKPNIPEFPNAPLNKDDGHLTMKKDIHLREKEKSDLEMTDDNIDATTEELYFLRYNDTTSNIIAHKSELIHHSPQTTTIVTKYQQLPLQPFKSVTPIRTTRELDTLTSEYADDLTSNMENTKVELIKKKKKANKAKMYSVSTSRTEAILESTSENEAQATPVKVLIIKNEYPFVRAQKDGTETKISEGTTTKFSTISANESKAPLYVSTGGANLEVVPLISDDNKETTTEIQFMSVMSTKTKFSSTSPSIDSKHIERRIGERESIVTEELTTYSNTEEKGSTIREIAVDFITTESVSEVTSDKKIGLVSEPTSESTNDLADKIASEWADKPVSIAAYESTTETPGEFARNFLNESTTTSAIKISSEVNDGTISETAIEVLSSSTSGSTSELATDSTTKIYTTSSSTSVSEGNKEATSTFPSDLASAQASNLASEPKSETTNKLIKEAANEPAIKLATETSSGTSNDASSQLSNDFASGRDSELGSEPGNEITSKLPSESANEAISESIIIEPTPQSVSEVKSEVEQSTQNKNKVDKLKEGTTALPVTVPISNQNAQIEKPIDESKHNFELTHATTENTEENATVAETQVITTVMPLSTTDNSDIEVKTEKFDVESTSRNYDSSEIMTKVPRVVELYKPNLAKSTQSQQVQNSKLSLQLGLVPEEPVTERKFESLIKFHTAHVTKEYSVYEIPPNEEPFKKIDKYLSKKLSQSDIKNANNNNKKEPIFVPVSNYGSEHANYNPKIRVKLYKQDALVNVARNNEQQGNAERIPIYDYSAKNAYFNPLDRLGPDLGEELIVRGNFVKEADDNEPVEISEAELQRILREDDEPEVDGRNEPDEISESELKMILREDELPSGDELQVLMKQSGATKDEVIKALKLDSKSKDVLRKNTVVSFVFPPNKESHPLRIVPLDIQEILDDTGGNSYTNIKPASYDNFAEKNVYSSPHKLVVDLQKLIQDDASTSKHIMSRDDADSVENSDSKYDNIRESLREKSRLFYPQKIMLDLQKFDDDPRLVNILNVRSNNRELGELRQKFENDSQRKPKSKKPNILFRSVLPGKSGILDVLQKAPTKTISMDYFDFDYYFGHRVHERTGSKKISRNNQEKPLRSQHEPASVHFPDSDEELHPYHSLKKNRFGNHKNLAHEYIINTKQYKSYKNMMNYTDPDIKRIEDRLKEYVEKKYKERVPKKNENEGKDKDDKKDDKNHDNKDVVTKKTVEDKKDEDKKDEVKKDDVKHDEDKKPKSKLRTNENIQYVLVVPQSGKSLKYLKLEDYKEMLDNILYSRVSGTKALITSLTNNEEREKDIFKGKVNNVAKELDRILHPDKTRSVKEMRLIMDHSDQIGIYDTLKKVDRLYVRDKNEMVESYITVMNDMISTDNAALVQYDWLTTTVEIRSALKKIIDLIESYNKQEAMDPDDLQLMEYLLYLYHTTVKRSSTRKANEFTRRRGGKLYNYLRNFANDRGILPKSYRNIRKHKVKHSNKLKRETNWLLGAVHQKEVADFKTFLLSLDTGLSDLHDAIKHIAMIATYTNQHWYRNLKELYLYDRSRKRILEVILHLFTTRLLHLIDNSASNGGETNFARYLKTNPKDVVRTVKELETVQQLLYERNRKA